MRFIGPVKQASRKFPLTYLKQPEFESRGQWKGVAFKNTTGVEEMYAFVWVDRDQHLFITNTSSLATGRPCERVRMRQFQPV
jgi:hypothetical protein